jgi:hypothetical protein
METEGKAPAGEYQDTEENLILNDRVEDCFSVAAQENNLP